MLGKSEKPSFYFDDHCFSALGISFILACASLFLTFFFLEGQSGVGEVSERQCSCVNTQSVLGGEGGFCANVHFKAQVRKVVGEEGDPSFGVCPGFKNKCAIIYIEHAEYIKESAR